MLSRKWNADAIFGGITLGGSRRAVQDLLCWSLRSQRISLRALPFEVCWMLDQRSDVGFGEWFRALKAGEQKGAGVGAGFLFQFASDNSEY